MATTYKYHLQPYSPTSKRTCPSCGRGKCFTLYLDADNRPVGDQYGICDHAGCGYRLYPTATATPSTAAPVVTESLPPVYYTKEDVKKYRPFEMDNALSRFLARKFFDIDRLKCVLKNYCIGSVDDGIIFWQIDEQCRVHRGKVMWYCADGHRLKLQRPDGTQYGKIRMMWSYLHHNREREPEMVFFGQHLTKLYPNKPIGIVESEKTALVMSYIFPEFVWLATLSLNNFQSYRLKFLEHSNRTIVVFPDSDGFDLWQEKAASITALMPSLRLFVSPFTRAFGTGKEDLADIVFEGFFAGDSSFLGNFIEFLNIYKAK